MVRPASFVPKTPPRRPASFVPKRPAGIYLGEVFQTKPALWYAYARQNTQVVLPDFPQSDRRFDHCYIRAATGAGKSNVLKQMISQDLQKPDRGVIVFGTEPEIFQELLPYIPRTRKDDLVYFNPMDAKPPIVGFNPFAFAGDFATPEDREKALLYASQEVTTILERAIGDLGVAMENVVNNIVRALLLLSDATLEDVPRLLDLEDPGLRQHIAHLKGTPKDLKDFWTTYEEDTLYKRVHANVVNRFRKVFQPPISTVLSVDSFRWHELIQHPRIILVDLSELGPGKMRETVAQLCLASVQTGFKRTEHVPKAKRVPYFLYIDEFKDFAMAEDSLGDLFIQARKQRCGLTIAHQTKENIPKKLLGVIKGSVAAMIILRLEHDDAVELAKDLQLHVYDGPMTPDQLRHDITQSWDRHEAWKRDMNLEFHQGRPVFAATPHTAADIEDGVQHAIDNYQGPINHTILMNLDRDQGQSIARIPGEHYGISTKIPLFKPKGGESATYAEWLIAHSKKVHGLAPSPPPTSVVHHFQEDDEDILGKI